MRSLQTPNAASNRINPKKQKPETDIGLSIFPSYKSSEQTHREQGKTLEKFLRLWDRPCVAQIGSNDTKNRNHYHWKTALKRVFSDT